MPCLNDHETDGRSIARRQHEHKCDATSMIKNAAALLLKCAGFLDDLAAASRRDDSSYRTYYAVDVDTILLYLRPDLKSDYMDVFGEGADADTALALTFLLGGFLFKGTAPLSPGHEKQRNRFLIIPPHDQELLMTLEAMHRDVLASAGNVGSREFTGLTEAFVRYEADRNEQALLTALRQRFSDLAELFDPYRGPKAGLARFASLNMTTFRRVDAYYEDGFAFDCLNPVAKAEDRRPWVQLTREWERRLTRHADERKPPYAIRNDAQVLAAIEHTNRDLQRRRMKLVLVTGSDYVLQAAREYTSRSEYGQTFAEMYLRHPQAFLAHEDFFPGPRTFGLINWLSLLLPFALLPTGTSQMEVDRDALHRIMRGDYRSIARVIDSFARVGRDFRQILEEWQSQLTERANARFTKGLGFAADRGATRLAEELKRLRKSDWSVDKLRELLLRQALASTSTLYSLTVWIGLWSESPRVKAEGIPELRFDGRFQTLTQYCEKVISLQRVSDEVSLKDLGDLLRQYHSEVEEVDPSLYIVHVIHALAFVVKGQCHATLSLATLAMKICDNMPPDILPDERGLFKGREAAYLACIAARRFASNRYWLQRAEEYLDQACKRETAGAPEDIRFTAERLTLRARSYYFDVFCENRALDTREAALQYKHCVSSSMKAIVKLRLV